MRQIWPNIRTAPGPVTPGVVVDLRSDSAHGHADDEQQLRRELEEACQAVNAAVLRLSTLIDRRENLKGQLDELGTTSEVRVTLDDPSIVAWGFCEDDDLSLP